MRPQRNGEYSYLQTPVTEYASFPQKVSISESLFERNWKLRFILSSLCSIMDMKQSTKLIGWSKKYISSFQGILNICEIVICYASIRLLWDTCRPAYSSSVGGFVGSPQETYFYITSWACLIISSVLLLSFTLSHVSYMLLERTVVGVLFWSAAFFFSLLSGLLLFVFVTAPKSVEVFGYSHKLGASILGLINSCLYAVSAAKSYRACKNSWSY